MKSELELASEFALPKTKLQTRAAQLRTQYGIGLYEYDNIWIEQIGLCAVCHGKLGRDYSDAVDHDHNTGLVRGILHTKCNSGLGMFSDNPVFLDGAASYLRAFGSVCKTRFAKVAAPIHERGKRMLKLVNQETQLSKIKPDRRHKRYIGLGRFWHEKLPTADEQIC